MGEKWVLRLTVTFVLLAALSFLYYLRSVTIPIMVAATLAYLLDPLIDRLEAMKIERNRAVLLLIFIAASVVVMLLLLIIPALEGEFRALAGSLPGYIEQFKETTLPAIEKSVGNILPGAGITLDSIMRESESFVKELPVDIWNRVIKGMAATFKGTLSVIITIVGTLIIPLYLYYILRDFDSFREKIISLIPERRRVFWTGKFSEVDEAVSSFIRGQLLICLILAVIYSAGLLIIGTDLAIVTGLISGALFIIPYIGTVVGVIMASSIAYLKFHDFIHIFYVFLLYGGAQVLEGAVITPRVIGGKMGLHPLAIIISIITGGELFGFMGMMIAVPAAAAIKIFAAGAVDGYRESAFYRGENPETD